MRKPAVEGPFCMHAGAGGKNRHPVVANAENVTKKPGRPPIKRKKL